MEHRRRSIIDAITIYDNQTTYLIEGLEEEIRELRAENSKLLKLVMQGESTRNKMMLDLITKK